VKWVGLFAIALVGLHTIDDLWDMFGDVKMPKIAYAKHWAYRILFLIVVPVSVYMFSFYLHFWILNKSGTGDAQMSSLFQAGLEGNSFHKNPPEIAFGSKVTFKNNGRGGGLLHSHQQKYPSGSQQQQVTCYHHKDTNNEWLIHHAWGENDTDTTKPQLVKNNDVIRLVHVPTGKILRSQLTKAPISPNDYEVSCHNDDTSGDNNDLWKVEIVDDVAEWRPTLMKSLSTRFRLLHVATGCYLRSTGNTLPQWGFKQVEVVCHKAADKKSANNMWNIEQHWNDRMPPGGRNSFKRNFLKDFADLNVAMWTSNNALTPDPDREPDQLTSSPRQWPFASVGLRMCGWGDHEVKFFLLGHPLVWWGSATSVIIFLCLCFIYLIRSRRKCEDFKSTEDWEDFYFAGKVSFLGWFLHYMPFWIMGRVTYLHHYFPALYFGIFLLSFILDHFLRKFAEPIQRVAYIALGSVITLIYLYFADFAFGIGCPAKAYSGRRWLKAWRIHD
ncbi:Protein O-mannosyltransferase 2, partial [Blyttiomyces sp. JEL0837]